MAADGPAGRVRAQSPTANRTKRRMTTFSPVFGRQRGAQLLDRPALVLVRVDVRLAQQHDLLEPLVELALDDLGADALRLVGDLLLGDALLALDLVGRDAVLVDRDAGRRRRCAARGRARRRRSPRCARRSRSRSRPRRARRSCRWSGCRTATVPSLAARSPRFSAFAAPFTRSISTAFSTSPRPPERLLALHHPRAGALAQGLDVLGADAVVGLPRLLCLVALVVVVSAGASACSAAGSGLRRGGSARRAPRGGGRRRLGRSRRCRRRGAGTTGGAGGAGACGAAGVG